MIRLSLSKARSLVWVGLILSVAGAACAPKLATMREAAEKGDTASELALAKKYSEGDGVPQDLVEAARWVRRAADRGDGKAQLAYGIMYRDGAGVPQDFQEARRWILKSADSGTGEAQYLLGLMYQEGNGMPQDLVRAHMWMNLASSRLAGDERTTALRQREWLASVLPPAKVEEAQRLAREWTEARGRRKE